MLLNLLYRKTQYLAGSNFTNRKNKGKTRKGDFYTKKTFYHKKKPRVDKIKCHLTKYVEKLKGKK